MKQKQLFIVLTAILMVCMSLHAKGHREVMVREREMIVKEEVCGFGNPADRIENTQNIHIDTDFLGGNIIVERTSSTSTQYYEIFFNDTISIRPDLRDTEGDWFYWCFRVSGAADRTLHFEFPGKYLGSFGPAYSNDNGKTWHWLYNKVQKKNLMIFLSLLVKMIMK